MPFLEVGKAMRDPQAAYDAAKAKGYPGSYQDFLARASGPDPRRAAQQAAAAAQRTARATSVDASTIRRLPWHAHINRNQAINAGLSTTAAAGLGLLVHHRREQRTALAKRRDRKDFALGATAGALSADAAYVVGGQGAKARIKHVQQSRGFTPDEQRIWAEHKQRSGLKPGEKVRGSTSWRVKHRLFAHYPKQLPAWRAQRVLGWKNNPIVNAAVVSSAALGGGLYATRRPEPAVAKAAGHTALTTALRWTGGLGLGSAAGGTAVQRSRHDERQTAAAVGGGLAGQGIYQGGGYAAKWRAQIKDEPKASRSYRDRQLKRVKRVHGAYTPAMERHYPRTLPEWGAHRVLGWTHRGRIGTAVGTAATVGGAELAMRSIRRREKLRELRHRRPVTTAKRAAITAGSGPRREYSHDTDAKVLRPGDPMYHGRVGAFPKEQRPQYDSIWEEAHRIKAHNADIAAGHVRMGRYLVGAHVGMLGLGVGTGLLAARAVRRRNDKLEAKLALRKSWSPAEPFMRVAGGRGGVHRVTILGEKKARKPGLTHRLGEYNRSNENAAEVLGATIGGAFLAGYVPSVYRQGKRNVELQRRADAQRRSQRRRTAAFGKAAEYGYRQTKTHPFRAAEFAGGAFLALHGGSRLKMLGPALQHGAKLVERFGGADAAERALRAAMTARAATIAGTGRVSRGAKQVDEVNHLVESVPKPLRPAVATTAGALLMGHAMPVRSQTFTPVQRLGT